MFKVFADDRLLYYPGDEEAVILDSVIHSALNDAGYFEFGVPEVNPEYDNIKPRISMIRVTKEEKELFYGEVREVEKNMDKTKQVYAVGELAFLFDSIQPQAKYQDLSPRQMLEAWLNEHNSQVEDKKKFYAGIVTVHDANDSIYRFTNQETTLDAIREKLCDKLNGYLRVRKVSGKRYLDLVTLQDYGKICEQPIQFGANLLSYTENVSASDLATACVPQGARLDESQIEGLDTYVDIKSVNGGKDYVFIQEAVNRYGWVKRVVSFDDVTIPANLKTKSEDWLRNAQYEDMILELTAIDASLLNANFDSFELGDSIHAVAEPFGMDRYFPVQSLDTHLQDSGNNLLKLGTTLKKDYTSSNDGKYQGVQNELEKVHQTSSFLQSAIDNATQMLTGSKGGYKVTEFDADGKFLRDLYMNAPAKDSATQVLQIGPQGIGFSNTGFAGPYKNAWTIDGTFLGEFIKANSIQAQSLSTEYKSSVVKQITDGDSQTKEYARSEITTSIKAAEDRITLSVEEEIERASGAEEQLSGKITVASNAITAEVKRATGEEGKLSASIKVNADSIVNKVSKNEFSSYIEQYYDRVLFRFNAESKYVQINPGEIGIYDGSITDSKKRASFNQNGNHFYRDGYYVGYIGSGQWTNNTGHKGLVFNLETQGKYMAWGYRTSASSDSYTAMLCFSQANSIYTEKGLHIGADLYGENFTLNDFKIGSISAGGYIGYSGAIPIVTSITDNGNGSISWQYSKLRVNNGIVVGYWN